MYFFYFSQYSEIEEKQKVLPIHAEKLSWKVNSTAGKANEFNI